MKHIITFLVILVLAAAAFADHPAAVAMQCLDDPTVYVFVNSIVTNHYIIKDSILGKDSTDYDWRDTVLLRIPSGANQFSFWISFDSLGGATDSARVTASELPTLSWAAKTAGTQPQTVPIVDGTSSPQTWLNWTTGRRYQSWVPDSVTTIEEYRPSGGDAVEFYVEGGTAQVDSFKYEMHVFFIVGGK